MFDFIVKRFFSTIVLLWILLTSLFFLLRLAPGGPFDTDRAWPPEIKTNILEKYGLNEPLFAQYQNWLSHVVQGDFKDSFQYLDRSVVSIIRDSLPISLKLGFLALFFIIVIGIPIGAYCAWKQNTPIDQAFLFLSASGISIPNYLLASILILIFAIHLQILPAALWDSPSSIILPSIALAVKPLCMVIRLTRASVLETLGEDYIRTAYAKGVSEFNVLFKHTLKNALIPIVTLLGPLVANLVTGSFVIELIFQIPGMGKHFISSILNRDYPLAMGVAFVYGSILLFSNFAVDLSYFWIDPRTRRLK